MPPNLEEINTLKNKAKNYFILGVIAQKIGMNSESATNFFKSLFATDDAFLLEKTNFQPSNHTERFEMLKTAMPSLYLITDKLFSTYRRTYTSELEKEEINLVKKRIMEAFANVGISIPTDEDIKTKLKELSKK